MRVFRALPKKKKMILLKSWEICRASDKGFFPTLLLVGDATKLPDVYHRQGGYKSERCITGELWQDGERV